MPDRLMGRLLCGNLLGLLHRHGLYFSRSCALRSAARMEVGSVRLHRLLPLAGWLRNLLQTYIGACGTRQERVGRKPLPGRFRAAVYLCVGFYSVLPVDGPKAVLFPDADRRSAGLIRRTGFFGLGPSRQAGDKPRAEKEYSFHKILLFYAASNIRTFCRTAKERIPGTRTEKLGGLRNFSYFCSGKGVTA